jgi:hypothetical protein
MEKLKVGYLVDDAWQSEQIYNLIEKSRTAQYYSIDYLIVQKFNEESNLIRSITLRFFKQHGFLKLVARVLLEIIFVLEKHIFVRDPKLQGAFSLHHLDALRVQKIDVHPIRSKSGQIYRYSAEDLEAIKLLKCDVLLRGGSGILRGGILDTCKFGIIAFHHGNNNKFRGGPPAFWEVFNRVPSTGFIIQRLLPELDGGDVFFTGSIPTAPTYAQNLARIYKKANVFMHKFLEDLGNTRRLPEVLPKSPYSYQLYRMPSAIIVAFYAIKTFTHFARKLFRRLRHRHYRWGIAYQYTENWRSAVLWKSNIVTNPPHRFFADPFVFRREGSDVCFIEDYDFRTRRGRISVLKINATKYEELGVALDEPFHLAYPFIFEANNQLYMCPETAEIKEIRLYRCIEFPLKWTLHKVLIKNISAVDSTIFYFNKRWWLMSNVDSSDIEEHSSELHLFYSETFDSESWMPHARNPVIFDSARARNGGFFIDGENCFRVFQRQGFDLYGKSIGIAKINELSIDTYSEEIVSTVEPHFFPKIFGIHSFSCHDELVAFDFLEIRRPEVASRAQ